MQILADEFIKLAFTETHQIQRLYIYIYIYILKIKNEIIEVVFT